MWILEAQSLGSSDERSVRVQTCKHCLTAGCHVVGRNVTAGHSNVIIEEDKSISRGHAVISVAYGEQACFKVRGASLLRLLFPEVLEQTSLGYFRQEPLRYTGEQKRAQRGRDTAQ